MVSYYSNVLFEKVTEQMKEAAEQFFQRKQEELGVQLNKVQQQAVTHTEGALLLLASPGSGKTTTIIMRVGYLIEVMGVSPSRIKAVTFSRASANDMKERYAKFFPAHAGQASSEIHFSTIHSLAFEIMREYMWKKKTAFQIIEGDVEQEEKSEEETVISLPLHKKIILRDLFKEMMHEQITDEQLDELMSYISYVKNKLIPPEEWEAVACDVPQAERIMHAYEAFKRSKPDKLLVDFDDMLVICNEALETDQALLRKYQSRYDYMLTDESQDTSLVQHAIVEKLVKSHGNLCVVADDDQSIYSWRAAEPQYLLAFKQVYPSALILKMEQNYRSTKQIVDIANRFIKRNKNRYNKRMFTENDEGSPIQITELQDYQYQAQFVAEKVADMMPLREVAILYRNNSSSIALLNEFERAGIPFYMKDGDQRFFSHWVVEDILNFMRMGYTDKRPELLEKIHLKFNGYITKKQMIALKRVDNGQSVFDNLLQYVELQDYQRKLLQDGKELFASLKEMPPKPAIQLIRAKLGYEKALEKICERLGFRKENLFGILNTLEAIAEELDSLEHFAKRLKHLEAVMKASKRNKHKEAVTFSTLHSAKGLEFEWVFMIDLSEGILPSHEDIKKFDEDDILDMEEAVRLFYVGMTRAKKSLELLTYKSRDGGKVKPSRFVNHVYRLQHPSPDKSERIGNSPEAGEVQLKTTKVHNGRSTVTVSTSDRTSVNPNAVKSLSELAVGCTVKHRVFGQGEVLRLDRERIEIRFAGGPKSLSAPTCVSMGLLELR